MSEPPQTLQVSTGLRVQCGAWVTNLGAVKEVGVGDFKRAATSVFATFSQQAWRQDTYCTNPLDSVNVNLAAGQGGVAYIPTCMP